MQMTDVSARDYSMYYRGSYVRDPATGNPAVITRVEDAGDGRFGIQLNVITNKSPISPALTAASYMYHTPQAESLRMMENYAHPPLGYRTPGNGKALVYIEKLRPQGSSRGLNRERMRLRWDDTSCAVSGYGYEKIESMEQIAVLIDTPEHMVFAAGWDGVRQGKRMCFSLDNELAVTLSVEENCAEFPAILLFRRAVAGYVDIDGWVQVLPEFKKLLKDSPLLKDNIRGVYNG